MSYRFDPIELHLPAEQPKNPSATSSRAWSGKSHERGCDDRSRATKRVPPPWGGPDAESSRPAAAFCKRGSVYVRFAPKATELLRRRELTRCANRRHMPCSKKILFDHFVGPYQERFRDLKAKRLRSFEIDHQLELG